MHPQTNYFFYKFQVGLQTSHNTTNWATTNKEMINEMFNLRVTEEKKASAVLIYEYEQNWNRGKKKRKAVARGSQKKEANR